jgi:uncharacterized protein YuzE
VYSFTPNGVLDVFECLVFGFALRPATRKAGTRHAVALLRFLECDFVCHDTTILAQPSRSSNSRTDRLPRLGDLDEDTILDVDADGNICAITVEHASKRTDIPQFSYEQVTA